MTMIDILLKDFENNGDNFWHGFKVRNAIPVRVGPENDSIRVPNRFNRAKIAEVNSKPCLLVLDNDLGYFLKFDIDMGNLLHLVQHGLITNGTIGYPISYVNWDKTPAWIPSKLKG